MGTKSSKIQLENCGVKIWNNITELNGFNIDDNFSGSTDLIY